jgi:hypothetical protein
MKRTVKCEHQDNIKNCPECWKEFSASTPPADSQLDEILLNFGKTLLQHEKDGKYHDTPKDIAEAKAKLQALISQEAAKARIHELKALRELPAIDWIDEVDSRLATLTEEQK